MPFPKWAIKDPDEVKDYGINWAPDLGDDTIDTSTWIVPAGITVLSESKTTTQTKIWLSGGTLGENYDILNRIVTQGGRTLDQTMRLPVRAK